MGRIKYTGQQKAFEDAPATIPNNQSIQLAVKGTRTSAEQNSVVKNMQTIASFAYLDMFDPKRTTTPNSMVQFRGYPCITIEITNIIAQVLPDGAGGWLDFTLRSGGMRVGFPYRLHIQAYSGTGFTPPEPDNPDSPSQNYQETTITIGAGTVFNQRISLPFNEVIVNQQSNQATFTLIVNYLDNPWDEGFASNIFYFLNDSTETKGNFGDLTVNITPMANNPNPFPISHTLTPISNTNCGTYSITGSSITAFSNSTDLSVTGSDVSQVGNTMTPIATGSYLWQGGGNSYLLTVTLSGGSTFVSAVVNCGNTPPPTE